MKNLQIPEYGFEIKQENNNIINLISMENNSTLDTYTFKERIIDIIKEDWNSFTVKCSEEKEYGLIVDLAAEHSVIITKAEYIHDLFMVSEYQGYFFGLYQIGEFYLDKETLELKLNKSFEISKVKNGIITPDKMMYLTISEGSSLEGNLKIYFLKIDWSSSPKILWKKELQSYCDSILLKKDIIFLGMREGNLKIWNLKEEKFIIEKKLFSSCISTMEMHGNANIILSNCSGDICKINDKAEIIWRKNISNSKIYALLENNQGIHSIDIHGIYHHLIESESKSESKILLTRNLNIEGSCVSNLIQWRDWLIYTSSSGLSSNYNEDFNKKFGLSWSDPLIRQLAPHNSGFYTGDDDGKLRFWKIGKMRLTRSTF